MSTSSPNTEYEPIADPTYQILPNKHQDEVITRVYGYKYNTKRSIIFWFICILFVGIPYLLCYWLPVLKLMRYKRCSLNIADVVLLNNNHGHNKIIKVDMKMALIPNLGHTNLLFFYYQHTKYVFLPERGNFVPANVLIPHSTLENIVENSNGVHKFEWASLVELFGPNKIEVEIKSYWTLFIEEVFNPFYVFQIFSMGLWFSDNYYIYATCILVLSVFSIATSLIQTKKQNIAVHNLVETSYADTVHIFRPDTVYGHTEHAIPSSDLVPGDLLIIPPTGCIMQCDAVLITGNCIVNESMLTGESVPVTKTPPHICSEIYDPTVHKRHTLFSGTHVLQTRYYGNEHVLARVVRTGFDTTKGALVKSILFPTPVGLKFYSDSLKFIFVLFVIAFTGMAYTVRIYIRRHADWQIILLRSLDIITIVVPPALPAAMTVGTVYSQNRLKKLGIFCTSPPRINLCGKIKLACFDKTGTLTHEGLDVLSVVPCIDAHFVEPVTEMLQMDPKNSIIQAMATCHSLTRIEGVLTGDPMDMSIFESIDWELEESGMDETARYDLLGPTVVRPKKYCETLNQIKEFNVAYEIGIIRQFPFSSSQQCMSVICRILGDPSMVVFTKGAPEKLCALCQPETVPQNFAQYLSESTVQGFRVIALAYKRLPIKFKWKDAQKAKREMMECDLIFLGFVNMQNTLKPETTPVIAALHHANIRTVMITGDNIRTAVSVARDCGMIKAHEEVYIIDTVLKDVDLTPKLFLEKLGSSNDMLDTVINIDNYHLAMDGKTWSFLKIHCADMIEKLLLRTTVFARFQPDQKTQLVMQFQKLDYIVSMVGDGANDCGALKAAHVGVSLSQNESSVAAPFTSSIQDISCIQEMMLEGRCALVTSFAIFKYMAMYSLIQFFSVIILYSNHVVMGDMQFLFIDLIITTSLAITIGRQGPSDHLVSKRPLGSLFSAKILIPLMFQIILCMSIQLAALYYLIEQPWFEPVASGNEKVVLCWPNTVIFCVSSFQYLILAVVLSKGKPYRESVIQNFWLLSVCLFLTCFTTWLLMFPIKQVADFFEILYTDRHNKIHRLFRYSLLAYPLIHLVLSILIESFVSESQWLRSLIHFVARKKLPKNKYKVIHEETNFSEILQRTQQ